ncbi:monooxygenase [Enhygromyxa salina]|uniref:monooxygenase n=1 Tax=Enhygromyxa salina TaxID=215803 RepID=UPI000D088D96|nr:monooxygenase [Enhygromyxa salina]
MIVERSELSYWRDAKPILDEHCVGCHLEGGIGPFALETWAQVEATSQLVRASIDDQTMPPWKPNPSCNSYEHERILSEGDRDLLRDWIDEGCVEGDPADASPAPAPAAFEPDFTLTMAEPYTPTKEPDDYRCFLIPWPTTLSEPTYVTAQAVYPGQLDLVHHVVVFVADAEDTGVFQALDDADPGPGYECFGGPGTLDWTARWLGDWVPGAATWRAPPGTGVEVRPGASLVVQVHYNTLSHAQQPDQTSFGFQIADEVEQPGAFVPVLDYRWVLGLEPMTIPAGDPDVHHSATLPRSDDFFVYTLSELGVGPDEEVDIWRSALHMHTLGSRGRLSVVESGGDESCLLQIDDWDFNWQGDYMLREPISFGAGDAMQLDCWYDNSAANQPIIDGERKEPEEVGWGDGSYDEMCLGIVFAARKP